MAKRSRTTKRSLLGLALLALLSGVPAGAEDLGGEAPVLGKDLKRGTVNLESGVVLHVDDHTQIRDAEGRRIGLPELRVARQDGPFYEVSPDTTVRWTGRRVQERTVARSIDVVGRVPE
jgi:hypothetical protein